MFLLRRDLDKRVPYERGNHHHHQHAAHHGEADVPLLKPSWAAGGKFGAKQPHQAGASDHIAAGTRVDQRGMRWSVFCNHVTARARGPE